MFDSISEIITELQAGRMIVLVDDEHRENEGDLVIAAEHVTPETINFMAKHGRGLICLSLPAERCEQLGLDLMSQDNNSKESTSFTVSIDAASGISSGISAYDRAQTVLTAVDEQAQADDLVRPGHVFPLRAREGGTLVRAGHTEGSLDLTRLAGLKSAAVICEILNEDGTMARLSQLQEFCLIHELKLVSVADVIKHRRGSEKLIKKIVQVSLPTRFGDFYVHCYKSLIDEYLHLAVMTGDLNDGKVHEEPVLVRVHSECLTGDIFHSLRCDCGMQLEESLRRISEEKSGVLLYIRQEGRGIGLINKLKSYALQEEGLDTVDANLSLGLPEDLREYGIGAQILFDLGVRKLRLLTNNPRKIHALNGYGLEITDQIPIEISSTTHNQIYLRTKRDRMGHILKNVDNAVEEKSD